MNPRLVLVVEDDPNDVRLVQRVAARAASILSCHIARGVKQAMAWLTANGGVRVPDIILLDWNLPECSGVQLLDWIRSRADFDGVEVVVWSGSPDPDERRRALQAGADLFLAKPTVFEEFESVLNGVFHCAGPSHSKAEVRAA